MLSRTALAFAALIAVGLCACASKTETSAQKPAGRPAASGTPAPQVSGAAYDAHVGGK